MSDPIIGWSLVSMLVGKRTSLAAGQAALIVLHNQVWNSIFILFRPNFM